MCRNAQYRTDAQTPVTCSLDGGGFLLSEGHSTHFPLSIDGPGFWTLLELGLLPLVEVMGSPLLPRWPWVLAWLEQGLPPQKKCWVPLCLDGSGCWIWLIGVPQVPSGPMCDLSAGHPKVTQKPEACILLIFQVCHSPKLVPTASVTRVSLFLSHCCVGVVVMVLSMGRDM